MAFLTIAQEATAALERIARALEKRNTASTPKTIRRAVPFVATTVNSMQGVELAAEALADVCKIEHLVIPYGELLMLEAITVGGRERYKHPTGIPCELFAPSFARPPTFDIIALPNEPITIRLFNPDIRIREVRATLLVRTPREPSPPLRELCGDALEALGIEE